MRTISARENMIGRALLAVLLAWLMAAAGAYATENAGSSYTNGSEVSYGSIFPPGDYHYVGYSHYEADHVKGVDGKDNPAYRKFKIRSNTLAYCLHHVWEKTFLGAGTESIFIVSGSAFEFAKATAAGSYDSSRTNLADPILTPLRLCWKGRSISQSVSMEFMPPLGGYNRDSAINIGRNYWQFAAVYGIGAHPAPGLETNLRLRYGVNSKNQATQYRSGDEFYAEFNAGYRHRVDPKTELGVQGYYYEQTTDDELRGRPTTFANTGIGNRGRVVALGPYLKHNFGKKFITILRYQDEFNARNRPEGARYLLMFLLPL